MNYCYNFYEGSPFGFDSTFWCSNCKCRVTNRINLSYLNYTIVKFCPNCGNEVISYENFKHLKRFNSDETKLGAVK